MTSSKSVFPVFGALTILAACSGGGDARKDVEPIDVQAANLDQVTEVLAKIQALQAVDPGDLRAADALERLLPVIDRLNHLVARIEVAPDHVVSFYEPEPGHLAVAERGPVGDQRYLEAPEFRDVTAVELYRLLAGEEAPEALHRADAHRAVSEGGASGVVGGGALASSPADLRAPAAAGDVGSTTQALTGADGPFWQANVCFKSGDFRGCFPNWGGGGFAYATTKTSFFSVAPYAGDLIQVRMQYRDSTKFTDAVFPGQWFSWWYHSDTVDWPCGFLVACGHDEYNSRKHRWDILQASGDSFHWTHAFKWNCSNTISCDQWPAQ